MSLKSINFDELKEITEPQIFDPPRKLLVWNCRDGETENVREANVVAILPALPYHANIVCAGSIGITWATHCAEIPEEPKPRRATNREFSKWLAQGNGECISSQGHADTAWMYDKKFSDFSVTPWAKARKWEDHEWREPTIDYLGINENELQNNDKKV